MSTREIFESMRDKIDPAKTKGVKAVYQFEITGADAGNWYADVQDGSFTISEGTAPNPNVTITSDSADWAKIVTGELNTQMAFMSGKLKIKGDMGLAMKLPSVVGLR